MADQQKKYPNIDYENLNPIEKMYIKKTETGNMKRAVDLNAMTRRSRIIAASIFATVSGIYFYTMFAVRQEKYGEEFDKRPSDLAKERQQAANPSTT